jgi:hypothetical protein
MATVSVISGSAALSVIVCGPAPGISKLTTSSTAGVPFEFEIAPRSEQSSAAAEHAVRDGSSMAVSTSNVSAVADPAPTASTVIAATKLHPRGLIGRTYGRPWPTATPEFGPGSPDFARSMERP